MKAKHYGSAQNRNRILVFVVVTWFLFAVLPGVTLAQNPVDQQLDQVMAALKNSFSECTTTNPLGCIAIEKTGAGIDGSIARTVGTRNERTDIRVRGNLTPDDAQRSFKITADGTRILPTNNVPPIQFWRTETFDAGTGQKDSAVLAAWLAPNVDSVNGSAFGGLLCGNLRAEFTMSLFAPAGSSRDKGLVDATQGQLKDVMAKVVAAMLPSCNGNVSPPATGNKLEITKVQVYIGDPGMIPAETSTLEFGRPQTVLVVVTGTQNSQAVNPKVVGPVDVKLSLNGEQVASETTDAAGKAEFQITLGAEVGIDVPYGISQGRLGVVATRSQFGTAQTETPVKIRRRTKLCPSFTVSPSSVEKDQLVTVEGVVWETENGFLKDRVKADVEVFSQDQQKGFTVTGRADGSFEALVGITATGRDDRLIVTAQSPNSDRYEECSASAVVGITSKGDLNVTVAADKAVYKPGELVTISGNVTADGKGVGGSLVVKNDWSQTTTQLTSTNPDGSFSYTFTPGEEVLRRIVVTSGGHFVYIIAKSSGYDDGTAGTNYVIQDTGDPCIPVPVTVTSATGDARVVNPSSNTGSFLGNLEQDQSRVNTRTALAQGLGVQTSGSGRVALRFQLEGGATADVAVNGPTTLRIGRLCRDASGKIQVALSVDKLSQIEVHMASPQGDTSTLNFRIVTPAVSVKSLHTRYFINVDAQGTTTVAALEGTVLVADPNGADGIELPAVNQIVVPVGKKPNTLKMGPVNGHIDPGLEGLLGGPVSAAVPQPNTNVMTMTLQVGQRRVIAGDLVLLPVWLVKGTNVANINLRLTYDAKVVKPEGAIVKGNLLDNALFTPNANQSGMVLAGFAQTSGLSGTGTLMNIPFRAVGKPGDRTSLEISVTTINDPNGGALTINKISGEIVLVNPDGTLPGSPSGGTPPGGSGGPTGNPPTGSGPTGSNPPGSANPPGGIPRGDCDGDGTMSEVDALCALEMSTQARPAQPIMDVDQSGDVTSRDAVIILQRALGK